VNVLNRSQANGQLWGEPSRQTAVFEGEQHRAGSLPRALTPAEKISRNLVDLDREQDTRGKHPVLTCQPRRDGSRQLSVRWQQSKVMSRI